MDDWLLGVTKDCALRHMMAWPRSRAASVSTMQNKEELPPMCKIIVVLCSALPSLLAGLHPPSCRNVALLPPGGAVASRI
jgi:hypothetical protein